METTHNEVALKELASGTVYEVRVRAWVNKKPSAWQIKEEAFKTKGEQTKDDGQAGTPQIGWIKVDDIGPRAGVAKWSLVRELNVKVGYDVQIRIRIEGKAEEWKHEAETAKSSIIIDGLKPDTLYEIRVRPWANKKAGNWKVLENAFKTRKAEDVDGDGEGEKEDGGEHETGESPKAPSQPGVIKVSKVTPNSALIHWGASKVQGETKAFYELQIRQRLAGKPTEWRYVGETFKVEFAVGKLESGTLYEIRVRAWANKTPGPWQIKENAFTTAEGRGNKPSTTPVMLIFRLFPAVKCASLGQQGKAASSWSLLAASAVQSGRPLIFARFRFPK
ncbi:fibronectin type III domain-containing protein [bacterium]|nr:fibronectin type III domain-containing protein [bacterium]